MYPFFARAMSRNCFATDICLPRDVEFLFGIQCATTTIAICLCVKQCTQSTQPARTLIKQSYEDRVFIEVPKKSCRFLLGQ